MSLCDYHIHTSYSDGKNTPREMVESAIKLGFSEIGFSDHSHTSFDVSYCIKKEKIAEYVAEINGLKRECAGKIVIKCGIEQDLFGTEGTEPYEYVIGSVHYYKIGNEYLSVDESREGVVKIAQKYFGGDYYAMAELYFSEVAQLARMNPDIIGHFDLVTKFQEQHPLFDEHHPRYVAAWQSAADTLLKTGVPFEINTGAIAGGYRTTPYPSPEIRQYLAAHGGTFRLSSDSHRAENVGFQFDRWG